VSLISRIERKIEMNIMEKLIAGLVERSCKNYVTTIIGALVIVAATLGGMAGAISDNLLLYGFHVQPDLVTAAAVALGIAGILAKDSGVKLPSQVGAILLMISLALMLSGSAQAQTVTPTATAVSNGFAASGGPIAIHYNGTWSAASFTRESYDLVDFGATKANHVSIQGVELVMPQPGVNIYLGGVTLQPDLSSLFKKVNVPAGSFGAFFDANAGNGIPSTGPSHVSWLAGGGVLYKFTGSLSWTPLAVQYGRFGGTGFVAMSTQLQFVFGGQK
jgi:hypothetical protein